MVRMVMVPMVVMMVPMPVTVQWAGPGQPPDAQGLREEHVGRDGVEDRAPNVGDTAPRIAREQREGMEGVELAPLVDGGPEQRAGGHEEVRDARFWVGVVGAAPPARLEGVDRENAP